MTANLIVRNWELAGIVSRKVARAKKSALLPANGSRIKCARLKRVVKTIRNVVLSAVVTQEWLGA